MAVVTGPLHCDSAIKQVGKKIIFQQRKRGFVAKKYAAPTGDPSPSQLEHRNQFAALAALWSAANDEDKASWSPLADPTAITNYAAYTKYNWQRLFAGLEPTTHYPPPPAIQTCTVEPGDPPASPDCSGTYERIADYHGYPAFERKTGNTYYIWADAAGEVACIAVPPFGEPTDILWIREFFGVIEQMNGMYENGGDCDGRPIVSGITL